MNDAPVNTVPGAQSVNEDTTLPIAGVSVADVDSTALTTTLTVTQRHAQRDDRRRRDHRRQRHRDGHASGNAAEINTALAGLSYTGNLDFNGSDTLTVTTSDGTCAATSTRSRSPSTR